jgi:hypothetical protein
MPTKTNMQKLQMFSMPRTRPQISLPNSIAHVSAPERCPSQGFHVIESLYLGMFKRCHIPRAPFTKRGYSAPLDGVHNTVLLIRGWRAPTCSIDGAASNRGYCQMAETALFPSGNYQGRLQRGRGCPKQAGPRHRHAYHAPSRKHKK